MKYVSLTGITPNVITVGWVALMTGAGWALAMNRTRLALPLVLASVLLDCLDGDLARFRSKASSSGSLLERASHWWCNMVLVAGAGLGVRLTHGYAVSNLALAGLCVAQAIYLAIITDVQRLELPSGPPTRSMRVLFRTIKLNYLANPVEIPLTFAFFLFGLDLRIIWGAVALLLFAAFSVFLPEFIVLFSIDRTKTQLSDSVTFPGRAVREADRIFEARTKVEWYVPQPSKIPAEVLRITSLQPTYLKDSYIEDTRQKIHEDLGTILRTSGRVFILSCPQRSVIELLTRNILEPGGSAIVIVGGPISRLWSEAVRRSGTDVIEVNTTFGEDIDLEILEQVLLSNDKAKVLFTVLTESTHGTLYDLAAVNRCIEKCKREITFVVDGTAGIAVDDFRMDDWGIDLAVAGCSGGLMIPFDMTVVVISKKALATPVAQQLLQTPEFVTSSVVDISLTPEITGVSSSHLIEPLHVSIRMILAAGLDTVLAHRHGVAEAFRRGCREVLKLELITKKPSAACTTAFLPANLRADKVLSILTEKYRIGVLIGLAPDGRETLCIGHSGWVFREDIYRAIEALALAFAELRESESETSTRNEES